MKLSNTLDCSNCKTSDNLILDLYEPDTQSRSLAEKFIHQVFARAYGANLTQYLPHLMALRNKDHRMIAALGMRQADSGPLFLETYLDAPVEDVISQMHGSTVQRNRIMEIGNLASVHRGGLRQLIVALTSYLSGVGIEWVVFTAVPAVRNAFTTLDLNLHSLAEADKSRLSATEQTAWGRYYETGPVVVTGRVEEGYRRLGELIELEKAMSLSCYLWQYAFAAGYQQRLINTKSTNQFKRAV